ncbi:hypothetical protein ACN6LL_001882, partial [Streptomyces violaceoruber]
PGLSLPFPQEFLRGDSLHVRRPAGRLRAARGAGHTLCRDCIAWPLCANGCGRVLDPETGRVECCSCAGVLGLSGMAGGPPPF